MIHKKIWSGIITALVAIVVLALTVAPNPGAASPNDSDDIEAAIVSSEQQLPGGFDIRVKGDEELHPGAASPNDSDDIEFTIEGDEQQLPDGFEVRVKGDEELLDSVWEKVKSSITDMPEDAVLTWKYVTTPPQTCRVKLEGKHCCYYFEHLVDGKFVDGDKFIVVIDANTLERMPVVFHAPFNETGSIEAWKASARPMIWDGSRPAIRIGPFYASPASCAYRGPGDYNDLNNHRSHNDLRKTE